jgi:uncharacterized protein
VWYSDPGTFSSRVQPFLLRDEPAHNLMLGVLGTLVERPHLYDGALLAAVELGSSPVALLLRTPPYHALISDLDARSGVQLDSAAAAVAEALRESAVPVTGVVANVPMAAAVAQAWSARTGAAVERETAQGVFMLDRVTPPPPVDGSPRPAGEADGALVRAWYAAFAAELSMHAPRELIERQIAARLRGEGGGIELWDLGGSPVSLAAYGSYTPNGARIGPVYTPPEHRRRGYAGALVAATTQRLLDAGRRFCFLNTDLANPTSNHIYQAIGYRRVCTSESWRFAQAGY